MFRLDHEAENAVRQRLGVLDADAFLARLEQLSFDIAGPLEQLYGSVTDTTRLVTDLVIDALDAAAASSGPDRAGPDRAGPVELRLVQRDLTGRQLGPSGHLDRGRLRRTGGGPPGQVQPGGPSW